MSGVTRRQLLKLAGGAVGAAAVLPLANVSRVSAEGIQPPETLPLPNPPCGPPPPSGNKGLELVKEHYLVSDPVLVLPPTPLGRVAASGVEIRQDAKRTAKLVRVAQRDEVLRLHKQGVGEPLMPHNLLWYETDEGYTYSSWVQPVESTMNPPEPDRAAEKFWGEITVPFSDSYVAPDPKSKRHMRLYYTSVYRIVEAVMGKDRQWWYRLQDGVGWGPGPYVLAAHVRRIDPSELTPISPEVKNKRIEVNLSAQTISAFEDDHRILTSRVASGFGVFRTPSGLHPVLFKTPTSRMTGGAGADYYDLPGVPFPTYITWRGVAIHGAYWHNDFGRPRSHGCLNVPAPVARWFWRWTTPTAPYGAAIYYTPKESQATVVKVS